MTDDDFDPEAYRLPPGTVITKVTPRRIAKRKEQFVLVPLSMVDVMTKGVRDKTWPVLCHLLHESWKAHGKPVKLANGFLDMIGVSRDAKTDALRKLESLGLISIERRGRKSPVVRIVGGGPHQK
jgi:hypothetical protein